MGGALIPAAHPLVACAVLKPRHTDTHWPPPFSAPPAAGRQQLAVVAGNKGAGGPFAPLVVVTRNVMGTKEFNQFRGKMISLHSQGEPPCGVAGSEWGSQRCCSCPVGRAALPRVACLCGAVPVGWP